MPATKVTNTVPIITRIERFGTNEDAENSAERLVNTSESSVQANLGRITRWVGTEDNGIHHGSLVKGRSHQIYSWRVGMRSADPAAVSNSVT